MNDNIDSLPPLEPEPPPELPPPEAPPPPPQPARSPWFLVVLAWLVIVGVVVFRVALPYTPLPRLLAPPPDPQAAHTREPQAALARVIPEFIGRFVVGQVEMMPEKDGDTKPREAARASAEKQIRMLDSGSLDQRLGYVILRGELAGPDKALEELDRLRKTVADKGPEPTPQQEEVMDLLARLYRGAARQQADQPDAAAGPLLTARQRQFLHEQLGWLGDLAASADRDADPALRAAVLLPAQRTVVACYGVCAWFLLLGLAGTIGLVVFLIGLIVRGVRLRMTTGAGGGVYAETFALWLVLFFVLVWLAEAYGPAPLRYLLVGGAFFASLLTLAWPVLRGVPWRQVRQDIGWTAGPSGALEPAMGVVTYAMTLPWLIPGLIAFLVLFGITARFTHAAGLAAGGEDVDPSQLPAHPVVFDLLSGDWSARLQILFLASVAAPIVEETMFRGVLYKHLREATGKAGRVLSVLISGVVASFLFAVVHPQGLVAVPLLMAVAWGFSLAREWRGSIVSSIVAHGLHNGVILLVVIFALGS